MELTWSEAVPTWVYREYRAWTVTDSSTETAGARDMTPDAKQNRDEMAKAIPANAAEPLGQRLLYCARMLHLWDALTDAEFMQVVKRLKNRERWRDMTPDAFETWWKSHYGNTPVDDHNEVGCAAMYAWDAATERAARIAHEYVEERFPAEPNGYARIVAKTIAAHIRGGRP